MELLIFGRKLCQMCQTVEQEMERIVRERQLDLTIRKVDLEDPDGLALAAFHDVFDPLPTTLLVENNTLARWQGEVPLEKDLLAKLGKADV